MKTWQKKINVSAVELANGTKMKCVVTEIADLEQIFGQNIKVAKITRVGEQR